MIYSRERFGLDKAEATLRGSQRAAQTVTEGPRRGLACEEIRPGYGKFSAGSVASQFESLFPTRSARSWSVLVTEGRRQERASA